MAHDKGLLQFNEIPDFVNYLNKRGIGNAAPKGLWQARVVFLNDATYVIGYNSQEVVNTPSELRGLIEDFRNEQNVITDTQRLEFMLQRGRQVICEGIGTNGRGTFFYKVYVAEGIFADTVGEVVHLEGASDFEPSLEQKRQIIDLAISNQRKEG